MPLLDESWLNALSGVSAPGESLKYDETYVDIKNQISHVQFDSHALILKSSELLLRSYDWQVCQFLLLACAAGGYWEDFLLAMQAYERILSVGHQSYPMTAKGRQSTLYWLNQSVILELLHKNEGISSEWIEACDTHWHKIQMHFKYFFESEDLSWHTLGKWLSQQKSRPPLMEEKVDGKSIEPICEKRVSIQATEEVESDEQANVCVRRLYDFYIKSGNTLKAMCFSRANGWSLLQIPKEQYGKTPISPIRSADKVRLDYLFKEQDWQALWTLAEQCFLQPGGPFDVKLQYYILHALPHVEGGAYYPFAQHFFLAWKKAYPALLGFHFNDGTPFCDDNIRHWVENMEKPIIEKNDMTFFEKTETAIQQKQYDAANWLNEYVPMGNLEKIWQRYLWTLQAYGQKKHQLAVASYQALSDFCMSKELFLWDRELMKKIWNLGLAISNRDGVKCHSKDVAGMRDDILKQIMSHDMLFAGQYIN